MLRSVLSDKLGADKQDQFSSVAELVAALLGEPSNVPTLAAWSIDGRSEPTKTRGKSGLLWAALMSVVGGISFGVGYWLYQDRSPSCSSAPAVTSSAPPSSTAVDMIEQ